MKRDQHWNRLFLRYRSQGDPRALGELFDGLSPELLRVARHVAFDESQAEDLVQATFLVAMEHPERFDESKSIAAWLTGVLSKEALAWRRGAARKPNAERLLDPKEEREEASRPEAIATREETAGLLAATLERLPALYRDVLQHHFLRGLSPSQIAKEQAASSVTVRVRLHRGLAQLRELLPAGVASGLVLSLSSRGHAAMRAELLAHANSLRTAATAASLGGATTTLGSLVLLKRITLGALALFLLAFTVNSLLEADAGNLESSSDDTALLANNTVRELPLEEVAQFEERHSLTTAEPAAEPLAAVALTGLRVDAEFSDGSVGSNVSFQYVSFEHGAHVRTARTNEEGFVLLDDLPAGSYALYGDRGGHGSAYVADVSVQPDENGNVDPELREALRSRTTLTLDPGKDVRGMVVDSRGQPIAGATIWVTTGLTRDSGFPITESGADGTFLARQLTNRCFVGARKDGFAPSGPEHVQYWGERQDGPGPLEINLVMPSGDARVQGIVLDDAGQPVAGARIRVGAQDNFDTFGPTGAEGPPPPVEVISDKAGQFFATGVAPGKIEIACHVDGYPVATSSLRAEENEEARCELRLVQGAWISGRVTAEQGGAVAGLNVRVRQAALHYPNSGSSFDEPTARTNELGEFRIGPLTVGEIRIWVSSPDRKHTAETEVTVSSGRRYEWNPVLQGLPKITGRALDASGHPLAGWTVLTRAESPLGPPPMATHTDAEGRFEFAMAGKSTCRLELYAPRNDPEDRMWVSAAAPRSWLEGVEVGTSNVRLQIDPGQEPRGAIAFELVASSTTPKTLATVHHSVFGDVAEAELAPGTRRHVFENMPEGELRLRLEPHGLAPVVRRGLQLEQAERLDLGPLSLEAGGDLRISLESQDGAELESLTYELRDAQGASWYLARDGVVLSREDLPAGEYELYVHAQDCGPHRERIVLAAGDQLDQTVRLRPGGSLGIRLQNQRGGALGTSARLRVTDARGMLVFEDELEVHGAGRVGRWIFAPFGELTLHAETEDGRYCELTANFDAQRDPEDPLVLRLMR